jgi:hypothetical protein
VIQAGAGEFTSLNQQKIHVSIVKALLFPLCEKFCKLG